MEKQSTDIGWEQKYNHHTHIQQDSYQEYMKNSYKSTFKKMKKIDLNMGKGYKDT